MPDSIRHLYSPFTILHVSMVLAVTVTVGACEPPRSEEVSSPPADTLAATEDEGLIVLFDGATLDGWRGFQTTDVPEGWTVTEHGALHFMTAEGDINQGLITEETFADFDLRFEWRVAPGGNSGVFFHVTEDEDAIWMTGPEYQIVDNADHADGENPETSAGANYGLHGPDENFARPAGEYNEGRIVVRGGRVEHFLNGQRVVDYDLGSEAWTGLVAESPFESHSRYGRTGEGHIALQEGGPVWFRNVTIRRLGESN